MCQKHVQKHVQKTLKQLYLFISILNYFIKQTPNDTRYTADTKKQIFNSIKYLKKGHILAKKKHLPNFLY